MSEDPALIETAAELGSEFRERSDEIEAARRIPEDVSRRMAEAGFYRMGIPRSVGGLETPPAVSSEVFESLAQGDASCAWVAFIGTTSGTSLSAMPEATARELVRDPRTLISGVFAPTGRAEKVAGGFRVSGRWQWGSGSQNARWILGGCMLTQQGEPMLDRNGRPRSTMLVMPASELAFIDTWHVAGLCGTGSLDYEARDVFVPEDRAIGYVQQGRPPVTPLYSFPTFTFLALGIGAVCMGIARASIDELLQLAASKKRMGSSRTIAEQQFAQIKLAQAEADLRSARQLFYATLDEAWQSALSRAEVGTEQRRDLRLATINAVTKSVGVVGEMYELGGGSSVYHSSRLQRQFRDVNVARSHIMVSRSVLAVIGGSLFGLDHNVSLL